MNEIYNRFKHKYYSSLHCFILMDFLPQRKLKKGNINLMVLGELTTFIQTLVKLNLKMWVCS